MNRRSFIAVLVAIPAALASARSDYWSPDWVERLGFHSDFHVDPEPYMAPLFSGPPSAVSEHIFDSVKYSCKNKLFFSSGSGPLVLGNEAKWTVL